MKHLKVLSLMVVAIAAMAAFTGVSSASAASKLCTSVSPTCTGQFASGDTLTGELEAGTTAKLSGIITLTCSKSSVVVEVTGEGVGKVTGATWTECTPSGCTATAEAASLPWSGTYAATSGGNGELKVANPKVKIVCGLTCTFTTASANLAFTQGSGGSEANDAKVVASGVSLTSACGSGTWNATYRVKSAHMATGGTVSNPAVSMQ